MDYIASINQAIDYIENNLTQTIMVEQVAAVAGYSRFYFDRLFLSMLGETPARYIRKRRLSEAARELISSEQPILDIALDYQFQSQEAFARPFKRMFGLSPGAYRRRGRFSRGFPKITLRRRKLFRLNNEIGQKPTIVLPRAKGTQILSAQTYALFLYRDSTSVLKRTLDRLYLFFG